MKKRTLRRRSNVNSQPVPQWKYPYYASRNRVPLSDLPSERLAEAIKAIQTILCSPRVSQVMALIIDGPEEEGSMDIMSQQRLGSQWQGLWKDPPSPSKGASDVYKHHLYDYFVHDGLELRHLLVDQKILAEFSDTGKPMWFGHSRLLEIVCYAIHDIAKLLFATYHPEDQLDAIIHPYRSLAYPELKHPDISDSSMRFGLHEDRLQTVGFWAEELIFGGLVVFDRKADTECYQIPWLNRRTHPPLRHPRQAVAVQPGSDANGITAFLIPQETLSDILLKGAVPVCCNFDNTPFMQNTEAKAAAIYRDVMLAFGYDVTKDSLVLKQYKNEFEMDREILFQEKRDEGNPGFGFGNWALQDYQMQLMLLERQNLARITMANRGMQPQ